jgi:hypothetical protein
MHLQICCAAAPVLRYIHKNFPFSWRHICYIEFKPVMKLSATLHSYEPPVRLKTGLPVVVMTRIPALEAN